MRSAARLWQDQQLNERAKASSRRSMACELKRHILPRLEDTLLEEIGYPTLRNLVAAWRKRGAFPQVNQEPLCHRAGCLQFLPRRDGAEGKTSNRGVVHQVGEDCPTETYQKGRPVLHYRSDEGDRRGK